MKNFMYILMGLFLFTSCETTAPCECENTSNGFIDGTGQSVNIGSESTVDVFKKIDAAWAARDYETMKAHIADDGNYRFYDGTVANQSNTTRRSKFTWLKWWIHNGLDNFVTVHFYLSAST